LVLAPSTLLAQVDASVGGKSAVNMAAGRNLVGAFHPAHDVIADVDLLASLPPEEFGSGLAELVKIAIISDASLFDEIVRRGGRPLTGSDIARAIRSKAAIVGRDPYERGERKLLNLGHTLGHALESASDFSLRHGEAVAIGIAAICRYSAFRGWMSEDQKRAIISGLSALGLPVHADPELLSRSSAFLSKDKKGDATAVDLIVVHELGKVSMKRVSWNEIDDLVRFGGRS
jgi:3-dehydroquinate synthase